MTVRIAAIYILKIANIDSSIWGFIVTRVGSSKGLCKFFSIKF